MRAATRSRRARRRVRPRRAARASATLGVDVVDASAPTRSDNRDPFETIVALIAEVQSKGGKSARSIGAVGVGVPGPVDANRGMIGEPVTHVPELAGRALAADLRRRVGLPVFIDNDVNALALGEATLGIARGARSLVVLSTGTGIGAGIVLEGRLVRGAAGFGGELGHVPVKFDGPLCWCGLRGCLSIYASGRGIADVARAHSAGTSFLKAAGGAPACITAAMVFRAAEEGDAVAASIVDEGCQALGAMMGTIVNGLNPEVLIVTGGVVESLARLEARIRRAVAEYAFPQALAATRIAIVPGDKRASVRGAAALARYQQPTPAADTKKSRRTR